MFENNFRNMVFHRFKKLKRGSIVVRDQQGVQTFGDLNSDLNVVLNVHHMRFYKTLVLRGDIGVAQSLGDNDWECSDLTQLVQLFIRNLDSSDIVNGPLAAIQQGLARIGHFLKRNTLNNAKQNILEHYDLSNDFFRLFLDETMTYSSGIFESPNTTLRDASVAKIERACRLLNLKPTDHLVEIGTGWGGLAIHAAQHFGCKVTTTTISDQQYKYAKTRIAKSGLGGQIQLVRQDYRQLEGKFDKLVSIEMIEAVGHHYFDTFFAKCAELLKPDGDMLIQAITIVDHRFHHHRRSVDFIKQFIFPGACLPSTTALMNSMAKTTKMRLVRMDDFASHYATTLRCWRERFFLELDAVKNLGFDDRFIRLWEYYLAYCEAAFLERQVNVAQMLFANRDSRAETNEHLFPNPGLTAANNARHVEEFSSKDLAAGQRQSEYTGPESFTHMKQQV
ncbi:MAG: cyclopropane-fatty-acyl-phospholipid synthase [Mariniblastus sp.]|nr:cyclopropane-fatty-acyl-phospholipid synthase [Mariniblastus sp.]